MLFRKLCARNKNTKLLPAPWKTYNYKELESLEIQNAKSSKTVFKRGEYIENKSFLSKTFLKKTIGILSIYRHHSEGILGK